MNSKVSGFTLLEVMIALTIFALIATTLSQTTSVSVDNQIHMERKLIANWIAENEINLLRSKPYSEIKNSKTEVSASEREWVITTKVQPQKQFSGIPIPLDVKRIELEVSLKEEENPLISLVAYLANDDG